MCINNERKRYVLDFVDMGMLAKSEIILKRELTDDKRQVNILIDSKLYNIFCVTYSYFYQTEKSRKSVTGCQSNCLQRLIKIPSPSFSGNLRVL